MTYRYEYRDYPGEAVDPGRNVNPSLLMDRERTLLRDERNTDKLRARVVAVQNGRAVRAYSSSDGLDDALPWRT